MFRWIIGTSLALRFVVLGAAAALFAFGALQLERMPVDVLPEFAPPTVEVQTEAIGLSAEEVESLITFGLEELLSGVPWLESTRSKSVTGLSTITLIFKRGTDIIKARQMVQERLALAYDLPNVASPPVILQPVSATSRFMMIGISSSTIDPTELSLLVRWTIKPRLVGVPGVANVAIWGQRLRQLHVHVHPDRLRDAKFVQEDIIAAAGDALWVSPLTFLKSSAPGAGGWIDNRNQRLGVEHAMPIEGPEDIAKVPVVSEPGARDGNAVPLGAVTETTFAHPPLIGDAFVNGGNGLLLVVDKFPSASTPEVTDGVEKALAELSRGLPGVTIDTGIFRLESYVEDALANLSLAIVAGAILVVLVVGGLLASWRAAVISAVSIPIALLAALVVLYIAGATINTMILAGFVVALGVVIDDAVVDADTLLGQLRRRAVATDACAEAGHADPGAVTAVLLEAALATRSTAVYTALIVILAVLPIFFVGGVSGAFVEPLALAYVLAVVASTVVALTVTPALTLVLAGASGRVAAEPRYLAHLRERYEAVLRRAIGAPRTVLVGAFLLVLGGVAAWPLLGHSLLPPLSERELVVNWATPPGTSHAETWRITARVSRELRALPGVRSVGAHIGRAVTGDQVVGINEGQIWVGIDPAADYDKTVAAVRETIDGYPGIDRSVETYLRNKVSEALTGDNRAIVVRIYGPNRDVLRQKAEEVRQALSDVKGVVDLRVEGELEEPHVQVKVNLDASGRADVKPGDVRRSSATVFAGIVVGYLFKEQKIFEVVVWGAPEARQSLTNLRDLWIDKADRSRVRLSEIADVSVVGTPTVIKHERMARYVDVVANVAGHDPSAIAEEVEDRLRAIKFPLEHRPEMLGEFAERESAQQRTLGVVIAALIGIFLLLQACFRSWPLALVGFLALPVSIVGGVLAVFVTGGAISLGSMVGFLAVLGIAARNGVLLIEHYRRLEEEERIPFGSELVVRGACERLAPVLASSGAIVAALMPIVALGKIPGLEIAQPIAIVVMGGLVASTLLTLFVLPLLYLRIRSTAEREPDLGAQIRNS